MGPEKRTAGLKTLAQRGKRVSWLGAGLSGPENIPAGSSCRQIGGPHTEGRVPLEGLPGTNGMGTGPGQGWRARLSLASRSMSSHIEDGVLRHAGDAPLGSREGWWYRGVQ